MPSIRIDALGVPVDLVGSSEAVTNVGRDWSRCVASHPNGEPSARLDIGRGSSPWLTSRVTREAVTSLAGQRVLLHAAGLSTDDGRVLVLVGPSGVGKTTACLHLGRGRLGYVTDETVSIAEDLRVDTYPKPLLVRTSQVSPKDVVGPDELGLSRCTGHLRAHRLVLLRRDGTSPARLERVPLLAGLLALIPETSSLARLPRPLARLARTVEACGGVHALHYSEIAHADELLMRLIDEIPGAAESWESIESVEDGTPGRPLAAGTLRSAPVQDALRVGDEVLILRAGRPIWLRGIGATIWTWAVTGAREDDLRPRVERMHGAHADAARLVTDAVSMLLNLGILVRV